MTDEAHRLELGEPPRLGGPVDPEQHHLELGEPPRSRRGPPRTLDRTPPGPTARRYGGPPRNLDPDGPIVTNLRALVAEHRGEWAHVAGGFSSPRAYTVGKDMRKAHDAGTLPGAGGSWEFAVAKQDDGKYGIWARFTI